jgi:ABC-type transport system substrate-binding protein
VENEAVVRIINESLTNPIYEDRLGALSDFQHWFFEEVPKSIIIQPHDVYALDKNLEGFDPYLIGRGWNFNNWTISGQNNLTYTVPGDFVEFNPLLTTGYFDSVHMKNVFGALSQQRGEYNITHPVPQVAESWSDIYGNGLTWEVKIRENILWSDGSALTAEDVLFTYHSLFNEELNSPYKGLLLEKFKNNEFDIYIKSGTKDTIVFEFKTFYPYVTSKIFGLSLIQKDQWESIEYGDWKTHSLNTGAGSEFPIGCGPYMITDFDLTTGLTLEKNPNFEQEIFGHDPDAIGGGIFFTNPTIETIYVTVVKETTSAIHGLATGDYDVIDSHTGINAQYFDLSTPNNEFNSKCVIFHDYQYQGLNYNHYDPRWGMNPHDPREMYTLKVEDRIQEIFESLWFTDLMTLIVLAIEFSMLGIMVNFFLLIFMLRRIVVKEKNESKVINRDKKFE